MATFRTIVDGTFARKTVQLPLSGARLGEGGAWVGETMPVDVRPLTPAELVDVQAKATAYVESKKLVAREGEPVFDLAVAVFTIHLACVDTDSPKSAPKAFFDMSPEEMLADQRLGSDRIAYLYEHQAAWQSETQPRATFYSDGEILSVVEKLGRGDDAMSFFISLRPSLRLNFTVTTAVLLSSLLRDKSSTSSASDAPGA